MPTESVSITDADLDATCRSGDLSAFDTLYERHIKGVYSFIFYRTMDRQTAEDLTSQTFLKALEHIRTFNPDKGAFSTWLYRIARNTVTDHFRSLRPTGDLEEVWDMASDDDATAFASASESARHLHEALRNLDRNKREIIILRMWQNLSYKEIAEITGKSEASCKMTFSRTVAQLRDQLPPIAFLLLSVLLPHSIQL